MPPIAEVVFGKNDPPVQSIDADDWLAAHPVAIDSYWNGELAPAGRHCEVRLIWTDEHFHVRFDLNQNEPLVLFDYPDTSKKRIGLWERDVCELFIGPSAIERRRYAEFEVAPTGEWLDLIVDWTKDEPRDWDFKSGMEVFSRIEESHVSMAMKIPWRAFGGPPAVGDVWYGNLFRQVGSGETRGYLTWSPTMTPDPQFHVPEKFGEFKFVK